MFVNMIVILFRGFFTSNYNFLKWLKIKNNKKKILIMNNKAILCAAIFFLVVFMPHTNSKKCDHHTFAHLISQQWHKSRKLLEKKNKENIRILLLIHLLFGIWNTNCMTVTLSWYHKYLLLSLTAAKWELFA